MTLRLRSLLLLFACAPYFPMARGTEPAANSTYVYELERYANAAAELEQDFLSSIEAASGEERFNLYWTYNQLMGTWQQIDLLQISLERSSAVPPFRDEEEIRAALRDEAQFVLWEIDRAITDLAQNMAEAQRLKHPRVNESLRAQLSEARTTVNRLLVDQCGRGPCAAGY